MNFLDYLLPIFTEHGLLAVFSILLLCGFGLPIPEDITLVTGGVIAGLGYENIGNMMYIGYAGVMVGDGIVFFSGRFFGDRILQLNFVKKYLTPKRFQQAQMALSKYGRWVMFIARFLPGLRTPIYFSAGMSRSVSPWTWFFMDGLAALLSVPVWIYLGYYGAQNIDLLLTWVRRVEYILYATILVGALVVGWLWYRKLKKKTIKD
ncbi:MAG: DedA family protein [Gammaproteobacteria bacterium]|nr:DedA family protein [Gammaproteobacteria bacterium]